jgi:PLP dependent protein
MNRRRRPQSCRKKELTTKDTKGHEVKPKRTYLRVTFVSFVVCFALGFMSVSENINGIRERMESAARRAGRDPNEITLMAVSKTFSPEKICEAHAAGLRTFGENRVQEFAGKAEAVGDLIEAEWHLIGHLQSNKANKAAELFSAIDSVDSVKLAEKLNGVAEKLGKKIDILIEVNVGAEEAKSGVDPRSHELDALLNAAPSLNFLSFRGLMTIPPYTEDPEGARSYFRQLRELRDRISTRQLPAIAMDTLSMGMSHDFEVAIEEGSTCVRVGTGIFGERERT